MQLDLGDMLAALEKQQQAMKARQITNTRPLAHPGDALVLSSSLQPLGLATLFPTLYVAPTPKETLWCHVVSSKSMSENRFQDSVSISPAPVLRVS